MAPQPKCKAHRSNGEPCNAYAMKGQRVCSAHGGRSPRGKAAAARRLQEEKAAKAAQRLAQPIDTDPSQALLDLVSSAAGEVAYWRNRVDEIQDRDEKRLTSGLTKITEGKDRGGVTTLRTVETVAAIEYRMWVDAQERLARYATATLRAGVEERRVRLAEDQGALVAQVIRRILDRLDLSEWQAEMVGSVVPEELRALSQAV